MRVLKILTLIALFIVVGFMWFASNQLLSRDDTYVIAESAFQNLAKRIDMEPSDFLPPQKDEIPVEDGAVVLRWHSKYRPECGIEVDVDRKYANARPVWNCN